MSISRPAMAHLLGRLTAAMGKPFSDAKVDRQAEEYAKAMGGLPEFAVEWAVDTAIRDLDTYPKASQLRQLARKCPRLESGLHDDSLKARMARWEADPWAGIQSLDTDRQMCRSDPCPICGSVIAFSDRGMVIVHDDARHREATVSYSNFGNPVWFDMPAPVLPESWRRLKARERVEPPTLEQVQAKGQRIRSVADEAWEAEQLARAETEGTV